MYRMLGIYLQSSIIITTFFSILVSILWYFSEPVLIWLHQDPNVAKMASIYLRYQIPGLFAYGYMQCIMRFLQTQSVVIPLVICAVCTLLFDVGLTYFAVEILGLGFIGASLATSISLWISFFLLAIHINFSERFRYTWEGFSKESFGHVFPNMKLAIPSAVMVWLVHNSWFHLIYADLRRHNGASCRKYCHNILNMLSYLLLQPLIGTTMSMSVSWQNKASESFRFLLVSLVYILLLARQCS